MDGDSTSNFAFDDLACSFEDVWLFLSLDTEICCSSYLVRVG
jgi:hypothetical protein